MNDDLIARLERAHPQGEDGTPRHEAAAEIKRLRKALLDAVLVFGLEDTQWNARYSGVLKRAWDAEAPGFDAPGGLTSEDYERFVAWLEEPVGGLGDDA
jgi:hypothetical protein